MRQAELIPKTKDERIKELVKALRQFGKHSIYCCWSRGNGFYDRSLDCTCGLQQIIDDERGTK